MNRTFLDANRKDALVLLCQDLVRCPSVSGHERRLAHFLAESMSTLGFDEVDVDYYGNVTGRMIFSGKGRKLLFETQMDHVEVMSPSDWKFYPYGGVLEEGRIFGRGATDQKGSLSAMVMAASMLKHDMAEQLSGELIVSATVQQECFEGISSQLVMSSCRPDCVVIGEASNLQIERGQRGRAEIVLESYGKMAHSANPGFGVNAALNMVFLLSEIRKRFVPEEDDFLGKGILELTNIASFPEKSSGAIPDRCRSVFDRRLLLNETKEGVLGEIGSLIEEVSEIIPGLDARVQISRIEDHCYTGVPIKGEHFVPAWLLPSDNEFIRSSLYGLERVGLEPRLSTGAGFGTNGCYYGGVVRIPTIIFGPSSANLAHITDEYIEIEQLHKGCLGYYGIAGSVLSR